MRGRPADPALIWVEDTDDEPQWSIQRDALRQRDAVGFDPRPYRRVTVPKRSAPPENSIWLSPACCDTERLWCEEDPGPCDECGRPWVPYAPVWTTTTRPEQWRGRT